MPSSTYAHPELVHLIETYATRSEAVMYLREVLGMTNEQAKWHLRKARVEFPRFLAE